ncbi:MAG TPA: quinone oxidoreductase [Gemmatimonadales bacterium]|nr:quinone oxidoreductase [Gemmatimonadales bacterium]
MRAIRVHRTGGPEVLQPENIAEPTPARGEVLLQLDAAGVNFIEIYQRTGLYRVPMPFTPGTEGAGRVISVGEGVTTVRIGDRVASVNLQGSYAEQALAPADRVVQIPAAVATGTAAAVMLQGLTAHYLAASTYPVNRGTWCLVHAAAGGVGLLLCQIARERGARVIGTVSSDAKAALAAAAGAEELVMYTRQDFVSEVRRITKGRGVSVVYDSVGKTTFDGSLECLEPRGMLVLFGQSSGPVPPVDPQVLNNKGSLYLTRPTIKHYLASREELEIRTNDLFEWIQRGSLSVRIDRTYDLEEAAEAHRALASRETSGKLLLAITHAGQLPDQSV